MTNTHGEAGRNLESADNESGFGSVDSDACNGEILVEARLSWSLWRNQDSWHGLWLVLGQLLQKLLRLLLHLPLSKSLSPRLEQVPTDKCGALSFITVAMLDFFFLGQRPKSSKFDRIYSFVWTLFFFVPKPSTELISANYTRAQLVFLFFHLHKSTTVDDVLNSIIQHYVLLLYYTWKCFLMC